MFKIVRKTKSFNCGVKLREKSVCVKTSLTVQRHTALRVHSWVTESLILVLAAILDIDLLTAERREVSALIERALNQREEWCLN